MYNSTIMYWSIICRNCKVKKVPYSTWYLPTCGSFKTTENKKRLGTQIANPQSSTFAESQQI
jgi:hypothetical protein